MFRAVNATLDHVSEKCSVKVLYALIEGNLLGNSEKNALLDTLADMVAYHSDG